MPSPVRLYRFDPYELDRDQKELRKFGIRLKLERKPLQLLLTLLDHAGEVVTRGEIQKLLWGDGIFVDFDKGLNVAVTKLRSALNDSSERPKFIETVAGEGYCFIAEVERVLANGSAPTSSEEGAAAERSVASPALIDTLTPQPEQVSEASDSSGTARWWLQKRRATSVAMALVVIVVAAFIVMRLGWGGRQRPRQAQAHKGKIMLVVLPFENLSGDPRLEYLSDGITEELSEQLGNLNPQRLGVIGRTSAMTYKHSPRTISQVGKELGVGYVLEGSVRRAGKRLRVTAQLLEVSDQAHVWAGEYDGDIRDLLQTEDEVGRQITQEVGVSVALDSPNRPNHHHPTPEAHQEYLLGRYYWNKRTPAGYRTCERYFRSAVKKDPVYAAAYAGWAECAPNPAAQAAARKAVQLDPDSGEAQAALGWVELYRNLDPIAAERALKAAVRLESNYAPAHHTYSGVLQMTGRLQEAIAEEQIAVALDPLWEIARASLAEELSLAGENDHAVEQLRLIFAMDPQFPKAHETLGLVYLRTGMYKEAIRECQAAEHYGGYRLRGLLGYAYARAGKKKEAVQALSELQRMEEKSGSGAASYDLAILEMGLGRRDKAMAWLEREYEEHNDDGLLLLKNDPIFAPLRSDPRFQDLLRRIRLS
ncbi:MAG TPA: winged helix-turn-helix domain-containing protein [Terriglobales bacterium]|nr:winged helix-turn-helix domain-containing protein [Terriglobales bacterium]